MHRTRRGSTFRLRRLSRTGWKVLQQKVERGERRKKTLSDYKRLPHLLGDYCRQAAVRTLSQIVADPKIMVRFKDYLYKTIEFRESHRRDTTISNKLNYANTFFRLCGI